MWMGVNACVQVGVYGSDLTMGMYMYVHIGSETFTGESLILLCECKTQMLDKSESMT